MRQTIKCRDVDVIWLGLAILCHLLVCGRSLTAAETNAENSSVWPKVHGAVFAMRNTHFSTPKVTLDAKGRELMAFECAPRGHAHVGRFYELVCDGGSFLMKDVGQWIGSQISNSGAFSLEATIKPSEASPKTRGVVLTYCDDKGEDVAIIQDQTGVSLRLGKCDPVLLFTPNGSSPVHVLISCNKEKWTAYCDGLPVRSGLSPSDAGRWNARNLVAGSAWFGEDAWRGRVEDIAVFSRALTNDEAKSEAISSLVFQAKRKPAKAVRFIGKLLRQAKTSDVNEIRPYTRSLTAAIYKIEKVLEGEWKEPTITVFHWMVLDGKRLPIADRKPGTVVELSVENLSDHPQLESCRRDEIEEDAGAEYFYRETDAP